MIVYNVIAVTGFGQHDVLSTHNSLEDAWYARQDLTVRRQYPHLKYGADGRQLCIEVVSS